MDEITTLTTENDGLKTTIRVLIDEIATLRAQIAKVNNDVIEAAKPRIKISPQHIEPSPANIERMMPALKTFFPRAINKRHRTVAAQLLFMHNHGTANSHQLCNASGLSMQGFVHQSPSVRKAGLVLHPKQGQYILGDKAKEMINNIFGE